MTVPFAPLADVRVIDLSRALAGPHAAMLLGDLGAHVIKVEAPGTGDDTRAWGPPFMQPDGGDRESTYFLSCNRNKDSISLDLKSAPDVAILAELIRRADVLVENFRPGVLDRLGFCAERLAELNPLLVTLSISGYGHDGPEAGQAVYDQIAQGEAGLMSLTGPDPQHPQRVGVPIGDLTAGIMVPTAYWPHYVSGTGRAEDSSYEPHCSLRWSASMPSRAPRGPLPARSVTPRATDTPPSPPTERSAAPTA